MRFKQMVEKAIRVCWLVGLVLLPWVYWLAASVPFEVPKVWAVAVWVSVLLCLLLAETLVTRQLVSLSREVWLPLLLLVSWAGLSVWYGSDPFKSFVGNYYRGDGWLTLVVLAGLAVAAAWSRVITLGWFARVMAWMGLVVSLVTLAVWCLAQVGVLAGTGWQWLLWGEAVALSFGNPHFLAGYLVVLFPTVFMQLAHAKTRRQWIGWLAGAGLYLLAVLATQAYLSLGLLLVMGIWGMIYWLKPDFFWVGWVGLALFVLVFLTWVFQPKLEYESQSRERLWHRSMQAVGKKPLTGWGWANVDYALKGEDWPYPARFDIYIDKAHASVIEVVVTTGVVGLALYVWFLASVGSVFNRRQKSGGVKRMWWRGAMMVFVVWVLQSQLNVVSISTEVVGWVVIGLALHE